MATADSDPCHCGSRVTVAPKHRRCEEQEVEPEVVAPEPSLTLTQPPSAIERRHSLGENLEFSETLTHSNQELKQVQGDLAEAGVKILNLEKKVKELRTELAAAGKRADKAESLNNQNKSKACTIL